jgi:UDP-N-acetylmuramoylalanine--D-glutamate ligase
MITSQFRDKKVGIWGLGTVGISALNFFYQQQAYIQVMDHQVPDEKSIKLLEKYQATYISQEQVSLFWESNDYILASPGIDIRAYGHIYKDKIITELDIFEHYYKHPYIAVTGSIGKTSVVTLLDTLFNHHNIQSQTAGNIGRGMLDLLNLQRSEQTILELSSFQLEYTKYIAPKLSVITNIFENHLDRHDTFASYKVAKFKILQSPSTQKLIPLELWQDVPYPIQQDPRTHFFSLNARPNTLPINKTQKLYTYYQDHLVCIQDGVICPIIPVKDLPQVSFALNWLIVIASYVILLQKIPQLNQNHSYTLPNNRCQLVGEYKGISFYNDSKSTIMESTLMAIDSLQPQKIIVLIGGLSKGANRAPFFRAFQSKILRVICFGREADTLASYAQQANLNFDVCYDLRTAFSAACSYATAGTAILLSPGGSSYDLFKNYTERGQQFCELVSDYIISQTK